jgi:predicted HicB family RNase H-like nuclease
MTYRRITILPLTMTLNNVVSDYIRKEDGLYHVFFNVNGDTIHTCSKSLENLVKEAIASFEDYCEFCEEENES